MVCAIYNGTVIAQDDNKGARRGYYFPHESIKKEYFTSTSHKTRWGSDEASYYTVKVGDQEAANAAWYYPSRDNKVAFYGSISIVENDAAPASSEAKWGMKGGEAPAAKGGLPKQITVTGFTQCGFFQRAATVANELKAKGVEVKIEGKASRAAYKEWLARSKKDFARLGNGRAAQQHTSSPFVVADGTFIGGCSELEALVGGGCCCVVT